MTSDQVAGVVGLVFLLIGLVLGYVLGRLHDRAIRAEMHTELTPMPGDAVRLDGYYWGAKEGAIAIIDGPYFELGVQVMICFAYSAFRGGDRSLMGAIETQMTGAGESREGATVSCSGGPLPFVQVADLEPAGEYEATFWRWADRPRAGGGLRYRLTVPLWSWKGEPR